MKVASLCALVGVGLVLAAPITWFAGQAETRRVSEFSEGFGAKRERLIREYEQRNGTKYEEKLSWIPGVIKASPEAVHRWTWIRTVALGLGGMAFLGASLLFHRKARTTAR